MASVNQLERELIRMRQRERIDFWVVHLYFYPIMDILFFDVLEE